MLHTRNKLADTGVAAVIERVAKHDRVRSVARSIGDGKRRVNVYGLRGSSPAFFIEALRTILGHTVIVCCADEEGARDACSDLKTISNASIELLPEKDIFPHPFNLKENLTVRGRRNACLDLILAGRVNIVVTSVLGFLEKTMTPTALASRTRTLDIGDSVNLDDLLEHLAAVGYEAASVIDEIGQFAIRGSVVDVFDPSGEHPVRLELLDNDVVSIRQFDIDSQRSIGHVNSVRILPATGETVTEETLASLGRRLLDAGFEPDVVEHIRAEIEHRPFSYLARRYAPALGMDGSLLDFVDRPALLFFWDENALRERLASLENDFEKVKKLTDEYAPLPLDQYLQPPDYYTLREIPSVHLWGERVALQRAAEDRDPRSEDAAPLNAVEFHTTEHPAVTGKIESLVGQIHKLRKRSTDILIFSDSDPQRERLADMLEDDEHLVHLPVGWITSGFVWEAAGLAILTDHQIFRRMLPRPSRGRKTRRARSFDHDQLQLGDFIVHVDYGIGRYVGLEKVNAHGGETECLCLRYQGNDRIFVPVDQMPLVEKYIGKDGVAPKLDRLGSAKWQRTKAKTKKALEVVAREMLRVYAQREVARRRPFGPDTPWQKELEAAFPFEETPHQIQATDAIKADMNNERPMERLICGDVGFGKTEVAIRAAFKAVNDGRQVAVLVPTTILALQHYKTFSERMAPYPVRVEMLSRFRTAAQQRETIRGLKDGVVDVVIGTHRLLSKDIAFREIGLLIIDEEHRFGVRSKEKLKKIKQTVDVLAMTATPIPRTLYMALSGLRAVSMIETPPRNRHPVRTEVTTFDEDTVVRAISAEIARDGQAFFLHNRVASIYSVQAFLEKLLPDVRFGVAHGQMPEKELEKTIIDFLDEKYDVLISTTIIESGLDFPNVNTIIINRADRFGLADLYQLRGRVGRRERQAFAYLLVPRNFTITRDAGKRLEAMEEFAELGSGYRLAMRDLEIRGAGNILGVEQHGQLVAVGFDLYCKMLREAVDALKGEQKGGAVPCRVETRLRSFLPEDYVEDQTERMALYRRLARIEAPGEVDEILAELTDRFGAPPPEAVNLIEVTRIKLQGVSLGMGLIQLKEDRVVVEFLPGKALSPELCAKVVETFEGRALFKSAGRFGLTLTHSARGQGLVEAKKLLNVAMGV